MDRIPRLDPARNNFMHRWPLLAVLLALVSFGNTSAIVAADAPAAGGPITFEEHIRPILKAHCFRCHGGEEESKGSLDLRLRRTALTGGDSGPAISPGSSATACSSSGFAPARCRRSKRKPTADEIAKIAADRRRRSTAPTNLNNSRPGLEITPEDAAHWSFQPIPSSIPVPAVAPADRARTPIDAFLVGPLQAAGLKFSPDADRAVLAMRAYFRSHRPAAQPRGFDRFLSDGDPAAFENLVDRLLDSPHYGERWGRFWLDVAGYADSRRLLDRRRGRTRTSFATT